MKKILILFICIGLQTFILNAQNALVSVALDKHTSNVTAYAIDTISNYMISVSSDKTLKIWDAKNLDFVKTIRVPQDNGEFGRLSRCAIKPGGEYAVVSGKTGTIRSNEWVSDNRTYSFYFINLRNGNVIDKAGSFDSEIQCLEFSPSGNLLSVAAIDEQVSLFNSNNMAYMGGVYLEDESIYELNFLNDTTLVIATDYRLHIYNVKYHKEDYAELVLLNKLKYYPLEKIFFSSKANTVYTYFKKKNFLFFNKKYYGEFNVNTLSFNKNDQINRENKDIFEKYSDKSSTISDSIFRTISYRYKLSSHNSFCRFSTLGDSVIIEVNGEQPYCIDLKRYVLTTYDTTYIEHRPYRGIGYYEDHLIRQGKGFYADFNNLVFAYGHTISKRHKRLDRYYDIAIPVPVISLNKLFHTDNYFYAFLSDGTVRWYRYEDGKEMLALFVSKEKEWILWTPEGYYYTPDLAHSKLIEWRMQNYMEVLVKSPKEYRGKYYRMDKIKNVLKQINEGINDNENEDQEKEEFNRINQGSIIPQIKIVDSHFFGVEKDSLYVRYEISNYSVDDFGFARTELYLDGKETNDYLYKDNTTGGELLISLPIFANELGLNLYINDRETSYDILSINRTPDNIGSMYALLFGVRKYNPLIVNYLKSAVNDVQDFKSLLEAQNIKNSNIISLEDKAVSVSSLEEQLCYSQIRQQGDDMTILFFSGHGFYDITSDDYYLLTYNVNSRKDFGKAIKTKWLIQEMNKISGYKVIIVDACYSGRIKSELFKMANSVDISKIAVFASSHEEDVSNDGGHLSRSYYIDKFISGIEDMLASKRVITLYSIQKYLEENAKNSTSWCSQEMKRKVIFKQQ